MDKSTLESNECFRNYLKAIEFDEDTQLDLLMYLLQEFDFDLTKEREQYYLPTVPIKETLK